MISLGIEGTAHTFGVGIADSEGKILANERANYFPEKGVHPRKAAEHHADISREVIENALKKANLKMKDIDLISFSQGPGLPPCLRIAAVTARTLALANKKPLIGVNHCIAHIEIGKLTAKTKDPIVLYVSGGNAQVIGFAAGRYRIFGETLDIAIGNAIDKFAREIGLPFPGGPEIEKLAKNGKYFELPYSVKGMDFSFSGLVTEAVRQYKEKNRKLEDTCFSFQETSFAMMAEVVERALAHTEKSEVLLTGGVAANRRLQEMLEIMCKERKARFFTVPKEYSGDNGAMIAWTGLIQYESGQRQKIKETRINQKWRTDEVQVNCI